MKFKFDSVLIVIGIFLMVWAVGMFTLIGVVYANSDCTSGLSVATHPCKGAKITIVCNCATQTNGVTWLDPDVYTPTSGSGQTESINEDCAELTVCKDDKLKPNKYCYDGSGVSGYWYSAGCYDASAGSYCQPKIVGGTLKTFVSSTSLKSCTEDE